MLITMTPPKLPPLGTVFLGLAKLLHRNSKIFHGVCSGTPIHGCCFKNGRNQCRKKCPKRRVVSLTEKQTKHVLAPFGGTPGGDFPPSFFTRVHTVVPHLYSMLIQICPGFGELQWKIPSEAVQSECNIGSLS